MFDNDPTASIDALEGELMALEGIIARARARQAALLPQLEAAQVTTMDGSRSLLEWTAARLDVTHDTARRLLKAAQAPSGGRRVTDHLAAGDISFDRAVETFGLVASGASDSVIDDSASYDLAGVRRLASRHRRIRKQDEQQTYRERYLATQTSLDGTAGRFWGQLPGFDLQILEAAIDRRADQFRDLPGPSAAAGARRADALVSIAQDSMGAGSEVEGGESGGVPLVTVFVDAAQAGPTRGEAGGELAFGPRIGPATLEQIMCGGAVQLVGLHQGRPIAASDATRTIPPAVRRFVMWRDGGCTIAGCCSRYRLQIHHLRPRSEGGDHDPDNLTTLCWHHHHVVIHREGHRLDPHSPPGRRRFLRHSRGPDPP